jgi:hypothetical protein
MGAVALAVVDYVHDAERILRDSSQFKWYTVTLLVLVMYVYAVEVERRRWDIVCAGLAFWLADWFNEIANALVLHFSHRAPLWAVTGSTSYLILIGLCIEICFMFALGGIVYAKVLPEDPALRLFGMPNRLAIGLGFSITAVIVELLLHATGYFHWDYWWWNTPFVPLIVVFGYLWFFMAAAYVFDMRDTRRQARTVAAFAGFDLGLILVFGPLLGWI